MGEKIWKWHSSHCTQMPYYIFNFKLAWRRYICPVIAWSITAGWATTLLGACPPMIYQMISLDRVSEPCVWIVPHPAEGDRGETRLSWHRTVCGCCSRRKYRLSFAMYMSENWMAISLRTSIKLSYKLWQSNITLSHWKPVMKYLHTQQTH